MDSLPNFITHGAPLRALRAEAPLKKEKLLALFGQNIKRINLNEKNFIDRKKRHKVNIVALRKDTINHE